MPNRRRRQMTKKKTAAVRILMSCILLAQVTDLRARSFDARSGVTKWPTHGWAKGKPSSVGLDEKILAELDGDLASGKYSREYLPLARSPSNSARIFSSSPPA